MAAVRRRAARVSSAAPRSATARQVIAFRLQRLGLAQRVRDVRAAAGEVGLPDYPPGAALAAAASRLTTPSAAALDDAFERRTLVRLRAMRGAPVVVAAGDYDVFAAGMLPPDESSMRAFIGGAARSLAGAKTSALEAVEEVSEATKRALSRGPLDRDQLHAQLRRTVAKGLLPYCRPCDSHHVHPALLYAVSLKARLVLFPRDEGPYTIDLADRWLGRAARRASPPADAPRQLVRRFLRAYGPATMADVASWAGIGGGQPRVMWKAIEGELAPIQVVPDRGAPWTAFLLAEDEETLAGADPDASDPVRLVAPGDPLLQLRDRDTLIPDRALHKVVWKNLAPAGVVMAGARPEAVVHTQKKKDALHVTVDPLGRIDAATRTAVAEEAARLGKARGCADVHVTWTGGPGRK